MCLSIAGYMTSPKKAIHSNQHVHTQQQATAPAALTLFFYAFGLRKFNFLFFWVQCAVIVGTLSHLVTSTNKSISGEKN